MPDETLREQNKVVAHALLEAVKSTLITHGLEHGHAIVRRLPTGAWAAVAGPGTLAEAGFVPGGGGFGGGGASGNW
jgi:uncharacterized membrane protein YgcG